MEGDSDIIDEAEGEELNNSFEQKRKSLIKKHKTDELNEANEGFHE